MQHAGPNQPGENRGRVRRRTSIARGLVATTAMLTGVAVLAGAGWDLWGSQLYGQHRQGVLADELEAAAPDGDLDPLRASPVVLATDDEYLTRTEVAPPLQNAPASATGPAAIGEAIARISIPAAGIDHVVVAGADNGSLRNGPGWYPTSAALGAAGNAAVAGHRTTYGAPFRHLDRLVPGDRITVSVPGAPDAVYEVRASFIVAPDAAWVIAPTGGVRLTLTTCEPVGSNARRLVVQAELVEGAALAAAIPAPAWQPSAP